MNQPILLSFILLSLYQYNDKSNSIIHLTNSSPFVLKISNKTQEPRSCKKCDKAIIIVANQKWDRLTVTQLEKFLCSFDKSCKLREKYKNTGATYEEIAFESLVIQLNRSLSKCIKIFDKNKNVDFSYILLLLENASIHDLPYQSIMTQLENIRPLSITGNKILNAMKKYVERRKRKIKSL